MASRVCARVLLERRIEMQERSEESIKFKCQFKRALIVFGIVEFVVTVFVMVYVMHK